MNRICKTCNIESDENNYLKDRTVCKSCYIKSRKKNKKNTLIQNQQPEIDKINNNNYKNPNVSKFENHAYVAFGQRIVGKTFYMLKVLETIGNKRPIKIINRSPNQYPNYKTSNENKPIKKYKESVEIFNNMMGARNSSQKDEIFTTGRHEDLDVNYISQSYFAFPRQSIRNNSDILTLFKQTLGDVQSIIISELMT